MMLEDANNVQEIINRAMEHFTRYYNSECIKIFYKKKRPLENQIFNNITYFVIILSIFPVQQSSQNANKYVFMI
jgi:hypothetical protein